MFAGILESKYFQINIQKLKQLSAQPTGLADIPFNVTDFWQHNKPKVSFAWQRRYNSLASKQQTSMVYHQASQTRIVAWARIDNREALINQLPTDLHELCRSDDGLILAAYLHWAELVCEHLVGDFAFAIFDGRDNALFCGRDHTGVRPFYYYFDGQQFAFATSMAILKQLPALDLTLSDEWLARFLIGSSQSWSKTIYQHIYKLSPAHTLQINSFKQKPILRQYFTFSPESDLILANDEQYVEAYREVLHQAVACRVDSDYPIGSESSGGLDSSTVTALAARYMSRPGRNLHAFGYDEGELTPGCIIAVSQKTRLAMTHFVSHTAGRNEQIDRRFEHCYGAPQEHTNATAHHPFYEVAQQLGIRTLLSGFGGDEFVTSAAPVALVEFWQHKEWRLFLSRQRGKWTKPLHAARWIYQYYRHQNQSITARRLADGQSQFWQTCLLKDEVVKQYQLKARKRNQSGYDGGKDRQNDFALQDRWSPMMTARYENCTLMAAHYGIEYSWPLMDIRLLKLFLSIPASQKLGPGLMGRYLHRRAVFDVLPEMITWQSKEMEPFYFWKRLGLWAVDTPLIKAFKRDKIVLQSVPKAKPVTNIKQSRESAVSQNSISKAEASHAALPELEKILNRRLTTLLDLNKVKQANKLLASRKLNKKQTMLLQAQLYSINLLNRWLSS